MSGRATYFLRPAQTKENALHYSAGRGNVAVLAALLASVRPTDMQRVVNEQNKLGRSPLLAAAAHGHLQSVQLLIKNHARVDVFDTEGMSALHLSAEGGHGQVCDTLLAHNAYVNSKSRVGLTPLHLAALKGFVHLVGSLVSKHHAAIDALTLRKETALQLAAGAGMLDVVALLVELGADADATDEAGRKAIHLAAQQNHSEVVRLLVKHQPAFVSSANKVRAAGWDGFFRLGFKDSFPLFRKATPAPTWPPCRAAWRCWSS